MTQHSTAQHSTAQHSTAQHSTAQHSTAQHSTAQHSTAQHSTAQHSTAQHSTAQHSTAQHSTAQHSTAQQHNLPTGKVGAKQVYSRAAWMLATALSVWPDCISKRQPSMKNPTMASSVSAIMLSGAPSRRRRALSCFNACRTQPQSSPLPTLSLVLVLQFCSMALSTQLTFSCTVGHSCAAYQATQCNGSGTEMNMFCAVKCTRKVAVMQHHTAAETLTLVEASCSC